jgi:hypothetical protein
LGRFIIFSILAFRCLLPLHLRMETDPVSETSCFHDYSLYFLYLLSGVFSPFTWGRKQIQFLKRRVFYSPEYQMTEKVQKPSNSVCYTPSSEPFRIYLLQHSLVGDCQHFAATIFRAEEKEKHDKKMYGYSKSKGCDQGPALANMSRGNRLKKIWPLKGRTKWVEDIMGGLTKWRRKEINWNGERKQQSPVPCQDALVFSTTIIINIQLNWLWKQSDNGGKMFVILLMILIYHSLLSIYLHQWKST